MKIKKKIKSLKKQLEIFCLPFFASSRLSATIYYLIFSGSFGREQKATLKGRMMYHRSLKEVGETSPLLRRNVHRIEKGLIMQPRRDVFALDYIDETVDVYVRASNQGAISSDELKWASDVHTEYFDAVDSPQLKAVRSRFQPVEIDSDDTKYTPYKSSESKACKVDYDQLLGLCEQRRSRRWFRQSEVDSSLVDRAIEAATLAPSACNRQPYYFKTFHDCEKIKEVSKLAMGTSGFHHNIPCLLAVVGDLSAYPEERDRHVIYIDASLAAMQLMLALETLGLGSCPINWPDVEKRERKMAKAVSLKGHEKVIMLIAVGEPDPNGGIPFSQKKNVGLLKDKWVER